MNPSAATQILETLGPHCRDQGRRARLLEQVALNGIDFVEYLEFTGPFRRVLQVHFLNPFLSSPPPGYGLPPSLGQIHVHGGTRIQGITATNAHFSGPDILEIDVDQQGDFSPYLLSIGWAPDNDGIWRYNFPDIDRLFSVAPINFRPGCPVDFDCAPACDCPPDVLGEPALDYLARDYASFRQMLLDLVAQRNPTWTERSPADIGIALLELFAYEGDHISYFQDAVANEAFLDTARQRVSAKRHAKLVDYAMHDGRNAWTYVHFNVTSDGTIGVGQQLVTRITSPMRFDRQPGATPVPQPIAPPGPLLHEINDQDYLTDPALSQVRVFETATEVNTRVDNNEMRLHTWGNAQCCFPRGRTTVHLYAVSGALAVRPTLNPGDYLLLEELLGPTTGAAADADPSHRQVVRITTVNAAVIDTLFFADIHPSTGEPIPFDIDPLTLLPKPTPVPVLPARALPLLEVTWSRADALTFPLCLSAKLKDGTEVRRVSVARGNIALADHGRQIHSEFSTFVPPFSSTSTFRLRLAHGPLTMQCEPEKPEPINVPPLRARPDLGFDVRKARPAVALKVNPGNQNWYPVPDLLSSLEFSHQFVVDVDDEGRGVLRFGDGEYGQRLVDIDRIDVWYRVGNGRSGNIGADALAHIVLPDPLPTLPAWPTIAALRNPLPARDGVDAELIEQVRQYAPAAFRAVQFRAVTEQDYKDAALRIAGVAGAVASFRWTGSWYTVFVGIDPADPDDVITDARGAARLKPAFKQRVLDVLNSYRLAGYDLEIRSARYVPLDVAIQICVKSGYFRGDVAHAVAVALSGRTGRGGTPALFDPIKFTFGEPVYLSRIYAAVENVTGVESATIAAFHRHGREPAGELESGRLPIGAWEIARLDNDRSNMENGTLTITAGGGS